MCGIWLYIKHLAGELPAEIIKAFQHLETRGPDTTILLNEDDHRINVGFHRLAINDTTEAGNQPFVTTIDDVTYITICNGELYNWRYLAEKYDIFPSIHSTCDTEILPHLIHRFGLEKTCSLLDGVFAFCVINKNNKTVSAGRDTFGVRPMFYAAHQRELSFASVLKGIPPHLRKHAAQFPPSYCATFSYDDQQFNYDLPSTPFIRWNKLLEKANQVENIKPPEASIDFYAKNIKELLIEAVRKRLMSDRPICCLLSGGLDSSLITSIVCRLQPLHNSKIKTFSIGMPGSTDLQFARKTADFLGTEHYELLIPKESFINEIPNIIWETESYDTTTIRASTGNYLISKYITERCDSKVVFNGDGSDEVFMSYLYGKNAPTKEDFHKEAVRLLDNIHYFDVLRSDRTISSNGLESRTPFLDKEFVKYVLLQTPISHRCHPTIEKYTLRYAFDDPDHPFLPKEVLWRQKEAFSDGVSSESESWHTLIQKHVANLRECGKIDPIKKYPNIGQGSIDGSVSDESAWYYTMFQDMYPDCEYVIPYYWMPKWCGDVLDPSARALDVYKEKK